MARAEMDVAKLNEAVREETLLVQQAVDEVRKVIVGQRGLIERMMVALLCRGHLLLEGVPGLAKTLAVKTLGQVLDLRFARIQFTPDLLPADLIGTLIYQQKTGEFVARMGPVFTNLLLADEINRAPAKVQSALLESMQERHDFMQRELDEVWQKSLAAIGVLMDISLPLLIAGSTAALAAWDLSLFAHDVLGNPVPDAMMERHHLGLLAAACGIGLPLAFISSFIYFQIPFGLIYVLALLAAGGLIWGLRRMQKSAARRS